MTWFRPIYNIAELLLYSPALLCAFLVFRRHEDATKSAWIGLVLSCACRVAAAALSLADCFDANPSLRKAAIVMDPVGLSALLYIPIILLTRINATMWQQRRPQKYFWLTMFPLIIAFTVGLIAALNVTSTNPGPAGKAWMRLQIASAFFLITEILLVAVAIFNFLRYSHVPKSEVRLLYAVGVALLATILPVVFTLAAAAAKRSRYWWREDPHYDDNTGLILSIAMMTAPEVVALVAYLWAGFTVRLPVVEADSDIEEVAEVAKVENEPEQIAEEPSEGVVEPSAPPAYVDVERESNPGSDGPRTLTRGKGSKQKGVSRQ